MQIQLDEWVYRRFARQLPEHEVRTVPEMGWASFKNGDLLAAATSFVLSGPFAALPNKRRACVGLSLLATRHSWAFPL